MTKRLGTCATWFSTPHIKTAVCQDWEPLTADESAEFAREDIASKDDDIKRLDERIAKITLEIPRLERERLTCERDVAEAKLKRIALQAKLDAMEGK